MPMPLSLTMIRTMAVLSSSGSAVQIKSTCPCSGVYLMLFESRLMATWASLLRSPEISSQPFNSLWIQKRIQRALASGCTIDTRLSINSSVSK